MRYSSRTPTWDKPLPAVADEFGAATALYPFTSRQSMDISLHAPFNATAWRRPSAPAVVYSAPPKSGRITGPLRSPPPRPVHASPYVHAAGAASMPQLVAGAPTSPTLGSRHATSTFGRASSRHATPGNSPGHNASVFSLNSPVSSPPPGQTRCTAPTRIAPLLDVLDKPGL